jgi:hypothetical protein
MPRVREILYGAGETAILLRVKLGSIREWSDTLADMRRGKTTLKGLVLLPFLRARPDGCLRPFYRRQDIDAFVREVQAKGLAVPGKLSGRLFEFDEPGHLAPMWKSRILVPIA